MISILRDPATSKYEVQKYNGIIKFELFLDCLMTKLAK